MKQAPLPKRERKLWHKARMLKRKIKYAAMRAAFCARYPAGHPSRNQ